MNTDTRTVSFNITEEGKDDVSLGMRLDNHEGLLTRKSLEDLFNAALSELFGEEYRADVTRTGKVPDGLPH